MPLKKLQLKAGVNKENTRYTNENGWYDCDKVRFRQGTPEKIGGWKFFTQTFLGICRSMWNWATIGGQNLVSVGTNLKFYINQGCTNYDITPLRVAPYVLGPNPFTGSGSTTVTVTDAVGGYLVNDFVTFSGATSVGGVDLNGEYQITSVSGNTYTITASAPVTGTGGGSNVLAAYQINVGLEIATPLSGWGSGPWGASPWGTGSVSTIRALRLWSQSNFGSDLVFGPGGGSIYYWTAATGTAVRAVNINTLGGPVTFTVSSPTVVTFTNLFTEGSAIQFSVSAGGTLPTGINAATTYYVYNADGVMANLQDGSGAVINVSAPGSGTFSVSLIVDAPTVQNLVVVSDTNRFIMAMGANEIGSSDQDPMLIRWSDSESAVNWTPNATSEAGFLRLSHGSKIVAALQARQEILVWTDSTLYSLQYLGAPLVWGAQLLTDNISIISQNATAYASGVTYWMGVDKFYRYDGRTTTLRCDLRQYIFNDIDLDQASQVFAGTNEGFNEVWWFYCSSTDNPENQVNKYIVYNYLEDIWYYGFMGRTAWLDSGIRAYPMAATYNNNLVYHENGLDDNAGATPLPIEAYISSAEFDIDDGYQVGFVWRMLPDITFRGSSAENPYVTMYMKGMTNSGSGYNDPASVGGSANYPVTQTNAGSEYVIEEFTGQINTRVRGRQLVIEVRSTELGVQWQLGSPRIDIRPDGRR